MRALKKFTLLLFVVTGSLVAWHVLTSGTQTRAQQIAPNIPPQSGGEEILPRDEITDDQRREIQAELAKSMRSLEGRGKLAPVMYDAVLLSWPVRKTPGNPDFDVDGISNFVDHNAGFPNQVLDWNCGTRSYDQASGYNHKGIDIFTFPFAWNKMDNGEVEAVAAAPGQIIYKNDGNFDRSCTFNNNNWNAVYVRHADGSMAWYGHLKKDSLTTKIVGDYVETGERLGVVGSSGNSTGPHLHFELYDANNQLQDPFAGPCNTKNSTSWWVEQPAYRVSRINKIGVLSAPVVGTTCPNPVTPTDRKVFAPGSTLYTVFYFRDQTLGSTAQFSVIRPDGTVFQSWFYNSPNNYNASSWSWNWPLAPDAPEGNWTVTATYNGKTYEQQFKVGTKVTVAGRVVTPDGRSLRGAVITLIDAQNMTRTVQTSSLGFYSFPDVVMGQAISLKASSKKFRFDPVLAVASDDLNVKDWIGAE
jgi:murein DD-endopeptidase MepM/ murein hydrolase activator NlpD